MINIVKIGFPQGTILGPIFYINDLICSSSICNFNLFTNDTTKIN